MLKNFKNIYKFNSLINKYTKNDYSEIKEKL